ncbi:MAG: outer membrane lipoprotein carrier protein LolA [Chitinophagaceae bacterium]
MRNLIAALLLFSIQLCVQAQPAGYKQVPDVAAFKEKFAAATQKTTSIKSDFQQEKNLSMLSEKIVSKGKFWFKKENLVRMEYSTPFQYLMILNKDKVYTKDGQKENKISTSSNKIFKQINNIMIDCVKGTVLNNTNFTVKVFEGSQLYMLELTPVDKTLKGFFKTINLFVDKKEYGVSKIEMQELSGDNTVITFVNKEVNVPIADALFTIH